MRIEQTMSAWCDERLQTVIMGIARRKNIPWKRRHTICGSNFIDTTRHRFVQSTALVFNPNFVISFTGDDYDDDAEERLTSEVLFTQRNMDEMNLKTWKERHRHAVHISHCAKPHVEEWEKLLTAIVAVWNGTNVDMWHVLLLPVALAATAKLLAATQLVVFTFCQQQLLTERQAAHRARFVISLESS